MFEEEMNKLKCVYEERIKENEENINYILPNLVGKMEQFIDLFKDVQQDKWNLHQLNEKISEEFGDENGDECGGRCE